MFFLKRVSESGHAVIGEQGLRRSGCSAKRVLTGWGKPMSNVTEYRPSAASLLDLAQRTNSPADKNRLLVMAEAWLDLADRAAKPKRAPGRQGRIGFDR
jgi:hypothetical protein